jgi:glycosyltransferase involved in cell wall biosynthesis
MVTAARFSIAGFRKHLRASRPDIVHGHYLSDYAFIAATGGFRPLVTSAWGSDVLRDPRESPVTKQIVRWVIGRSALITYNADALAEACTRLGARAAQLVKVVMGVDSAFLDATKGNPAPSARAPVIISHRSLDRTIFNVDVIISAMPEVVRRVPEARLLIGNSGRLEPDLRALASRLGVGSSVQFIGRAADELELADRLGRAAVYASIPDTDGSSVTLLQAMAAGSFPVVSDIPSNREWIDREGGAVVPLRDAPALATALADALLDAERREVAAERNREVIAREATWDRNMDRMEQAYRQLV